MKALVQNLNRLPLVAKIKGNRVSVEETNTQKANGSQNKSKRGQHGRNKYPEGQWTVNVVSPVGEPIEPLDVCAKFRNAIGSIVRTKMVFGSNDP